MKTSLMTEEIREESRPKKSNLDSPIKIEIVANRHRFKSKTKSTKINTIKNIANKMDISSLIEYYRPKKLGKDELNVANMILNSVNLKIAPELRQHLKTLSSDKPNSNTSDIQKFVSKIMKISNETVKKNNNPKLESVQKSVLKIIHDFVDSLANAHSESITKQ